MQELLLLSMCHGKAASLRQMTSGSAVERFCRAGEENLDFVDSLRESSIKLMVTRHEQTAGFMAATIGRLTGKSGVALATLGAGRHQFHDLSGICPLWCAFNDAAVLVIRSFREQGLVWDAPSHRCAGPTQVDMHDQAEHCSSCSCQLFAPDAYAHRDAGAFPVLFITGQKPILKSKQGAFQIVDIVKLFHNVTKFCKQVSR